MNLPEQSDLRQQSDAAQVDDRGPGRPNLNPLEAGES